MIEDYQAGSVDNIILCWHFLRGLFLDKQSPVSLREIQKKGIFKRDETSVGAKMVK